MKAKKLLIGAAVLAAGSLACMRAGAQPSIPYAQDIAALVERSFSQAG